MNDSFGSNFNDQFGHSNDVDTDNESNDVDGGSFGCNQLVGSAMGVREGKGTIQKIPDHVFQV